MPIGWLPVWANVADINHKHLVVILSKITYKINGIVVLRIGCNQKNCKIRLKLVVFLISPQMIVSMFESSIHANIKTMNYFLAEKIVIFIIDAGQVSLIVIRFTLTKQFLDSQKSECNFFKIKSEKYGQHIYSIHWNLFFFHKE